jgi:YHS domain-containing protein
MLRVILLALLILIIARAFWRVMDGVIEASGGSGRSGRGRTTPSVKLQRDPICGTYVAPATALAHTSGATTVYFCSDRCRDEYLARNRRG